MTLPPVLSSLVGWQRATRQGDPVDERVRTQLATAGPFI